MPTETAVRTVRIVPTAPRAADVPAGAQVWTPSPAVARALARRQRTPAAEATGDLARAGLRIADEALAWRILGAAIREVLPSEPAGLRRALQEPIARLTREGLADLPAERLPAGLSVATVRAHAIARAARAHVAKAGAVPAAALYRAALAAGAVRRFEPLALIGMHDLDGGFAEWWDAVAGPGSLVLLPPEQEGAAHRLAGFGWHVDRTPRRLRRRGERYAQAFLAGEQNPAPNEPPAVLRYPSHEEQLRDLVVRTRTWAARTPPRGAEAVVWFARQPERLILALDGIAWEAGLRFRIDAPTPLRDSGPGEVLSGLFEVLRDDAPFEATLRLLRHRCVAGIDEDAYRAARAARPEGFAAWERYLPGFAAFALPPRAARAELVATCTAAVQALLRAPGDLPDRDREAATQLHAGLPNLAEDAPEARLTADTFLQEASAWLDAATVPAAPFGAGASELPPIPLLAYHQGAGRRCRAALFPDLVEGLVPLPLAEETVLDAFDRMVLNDHGLPVRTVAERAASEARDFAAALRAVDGPAIFGVPQWTNQRACTPSAYLERFAPAPVPAPARPPLGIEERRVLGAAPQDEEAAFVRHAAAVEREREGPAPFGRFDGVTGVFTDLELRPFSAGQLQDAGACPFRWFARHRLSLREAAEREAVLTPQERGRLLHAALHEAVRAGLAEIGIEPPPPERAESDREALRQAILRALPTAFAQAERDVAAAAGPGWRRARGGELRALARLVASEAFLAPGLWPWRLEARFRGRIDELPVVGVVDRIDRAHDGGSEFVDYKTGLNPPAGVPARPGRSKLDPQLPLYLTAGAQALTPHDPPRGGRYLSVRGAKSLREVPAPQDAPELYAALAGLAREVRARAREGDWPVAPDPRFEACRRCDLGAVCRVGPRVTRKLRAAADESETGPP